WLPALLPEKTGSPPGQAECTPKAFDLFYSDYMRPEQPTAAACYDRLKRVAKKNGWTIPTVSTLLRRVRQIAGPGVITLERVGPKALQATYPAQERDKTHMHAMEAVNADGHKFDVFVKWPDGYICRPVAVAWQDVYSGFILSYRVDKTENVESVRLSFGDMVNDYGIPSHAYLDNGHSFSSKWLTGRIKNRFRFKIKEEEPAGILTSMGVEVHWCTPYHGQAKPIERTFRDLCDYVSKHPALSGAYTGNKPTAKPENYGSKAVPLEEFKRVLNEEIICHNAREGRRSEVCDGKSLKQAFEKSYVKVPIRKATENQRRLWLLAAENVRVSRVDSSIRLMKNRFWASALADKGLYGEAVTVRFDPDNLGGGVFVYNQEGDYLCAADRIGVAGFNDATAAKEHNKTRRHYIKSTKAAAKSLKRMTAIEVAGSIPAPEEPKKHKAKVIELVTGGGKRIDAAGGKGSPLTPKEENKRLEAEREAKMIKQTELLEKLNRQAVLEGRGVYKHWTKEEREEHVSRRYPKKKAGDE
ncbi:MAG: Mu transposase C-terminal domain-containing protein, partial [Nitrospinota bacterium]|nr:Mu transposase C-terminal domain-containing protein [Nitrospinota bacterium]